MTPRENLIRSLKGIMVSIGPDRTKLNREHFRAACEAFADADAIACLHIYDRKHMGCEPCRAAILKEVGIDAD